MLPKNRKPTHPGEFLADFLEAHNLTQAEFARHLGGGWSQAKVNQILKGRRGVTPKTALAFADAFGNSPEFWLNAQRSVDLWQARTEHQPVRKLKRVS